MRRGARPAHRAARAVALASAALLLTGCAQSVDPIERLGKKAAEGVRRSAPAPERAYRHWGLTAPLAAPPRHAARPLSVRTGTRVVDRVTTADRVVFLTYDEAAVRDPRLADLVRELRLPVTVFAGADALGSGRAARLRAAGVTLGGRLPHGLSRSRQRDELCAARTRLTRAHAEVHDAATLRAAADCGITALVHWRAETTRHGLTYAHTPEHLTPGDIIRVTPDRKGALAERTGRVLREAQERGLTAGKLGDYL
ncbi:polysaccharide deacetylase family protein [Streptomyces sp. NBC_01171]|uniref:polysaccharide deacetylase family protein n=1 Tax=Streptomyces sp. NBC_01171 TaxID=2903757 RepID=UPI003866F647|nr:polysaccharide deacetylase family protein [Streptomyces sp. NBC_01171]